MNHDIRLKKTNGWRSTSIQDPEDGEYVLIAYSPSDPIDTKLMVEVSYYYGGTFSVCQDYNWDVEIDGVKWWMRLSDIPLPEKK